MNKLIAATLVACVAAPAVADETTGHVLAYDRKADVLVLTDLTVWYLPSTLLVPTDLGAGDLVALTYESAGEDGLTSIDELRREAVAMPEGTDDGS